MRASLEAGLPTLPGVATASEIQRGLDLGLSWFKAFPASALGTGWFSAMRGPFPQVRFVATGGVNIAMARAFLDAGVRVVSFGSSIGTGSTMGEIADIARSRPATVGTEGDGLRSIVAAEHDPLIEAERPPAYHSAYEPSS